MAYSSTPGSSIERQTLAKHIVVDPTAGGNDNYAPVDDVNAPVIFWVHRQGDGTAGDIHVETEGGEDVTFHLALGATSPCYCKRLFSDSANAGDLIVGWR